MLKYELYKPWHTGEDAWGIEILDGEFSGTIIQIHEVNFNEKEESGLDVQYTVLNRSQTDEVLYNSDMFVSVFSIIINDILKEAVQDYESSRANGIQEPS